LALQGIEEFVVVQYSTKGFVSLLVMMMNKKTLSDSGMLFCRKTKKALYNTKESCHRFHKLFQNHVRELYPC